MKLLLDLEESMRLDGGPHQSRGSVPRIMQRYYSVTGRRRLGRMPCPSVLWRVHQ
jgi:hypothetical protein